MAASKAKVDSKFQSKVGGFGLLWILFNSKAKQSSGPQNPKEFPKFQSGGAAREREAPAPAPTRKVNTVVSAFTTVVASKRTLPRNGENSKECNKSDLDDLQKMLLLHSFVLYYYAQNRESQRSAHQQITEVERCY